MNQLGLYYPNGNFKSDSDIKRDLALETPPPILKTPRKSITKGFDYWNDRAREEQRLYMETEESSNYAEIELPDTSLVTFQADQHIGGAYVDHDRLRQEAEVIVNQNGSYIFLLGDLIDAFSFNPAQYSDIQQIQEQIEYAKAYVKFLADSGKLLGVWTGNHDQWVKKAGFNPYRYILDGIDTYYFHGIGYVKIGIQGAEYRITGNHIFKGNSQFNNSHPQRRAMNESARNSHIVVGGHWHTKGIQQQAFQVFGGESEVCTMIALGTYKATDEYIKTYGFNNRSSTDMYGVTVQLEAGKHQVVPYYDTLLAHEQYAGRN